MAAQPFAERQRDGQHEDAAGAGGQISRRERRSPAPGKTARKARQAPTTPSGIAQANLSASTRKAAPSHHKPGQEEAEAPPPAGRDGRARNAAPRVRPTAPSIEPDGDRSSARRSSGQRSSGASASAPLAPAERAQSAALRPSPGEDDGLSRPAPRAASAGFTEPVSRGRSARRRWMRQALDAARIGVEDLEFERPPAPGSVSPRVGTRPASVTISPPSVSTSSATSALGQVDRRSPACSSSSVARASAMKLFSPAGAIVGASSRSCSSSMSPTTISTRSSIETSPSVPPYSSITRRDMGARRLHADQEVDAPASRGARRAPAAGSCRRRKRASRGRSPPRSSGYGSPARCASGPAVGAVPAMIVEEVADVDHRRGVVERVAIDRQARMAGGAEHGRAASPSVASAGDRDDVGARHHHVADAALAQAQHVGEHRPLLRRRDRRARRSSSPGPRRSPRGPCCRQRRPSRSRNWPSQLAEAAAVVFGLRLDRLSSLMVVGCSAMEGAEHAVTSSAAGIGVGDAETGEARPRAPSMRGACGLGLVILAEQMEQPVDDEMAEMVGRWSCPRPRPPAPPSHRARTISPSTRARRDALRRRGREGEHVRRLVEAAPVAIDDANALVVGQQQAQLGSRRGRRGATASPAASASATSACRLASLPSSCQRRDWP